MSERKIVGWVVVLLPKEKGGKREYGGGDGSLTSERSNRKVYDLSSQAASEFLDVACWIESEAIRRLRILPLYAKKKRTAEDERKDVLAWLDKEDYVVIRGRIEAGEHVGAAK